MTEPFLVETPLLPLAISVSGYAVTRIRLGAAAYRRAVTPIERCVADELANYFSGSLTQFSVRTAPDGTAFQRAVWGQLCEIPYGETRTYRDIAAALGNPGAARAVGMANHHNPIPIVIPCHRVVASGGRLGGYGGGVELKRELLRLEAAKVPLW